MRRIIKLLLLLLPLILTNKVYAAVDLIFDDGNPILEIYDSNYLDGDLGGINKYYVPANRGMGFKLLVTGRRTTRIKKGKEVILEDIKPASIDIDIATSSGINCTINNVRSDIYSLNGHTLNIVNEQANLTETLISNIVCTMPSTDNLIKLSSDNYLSIALTANNRNYIGGDTSTETITYKFNLGVINTEYLNSLNNSKEINSITFDGKAADDSSQTIEVKSPSTKMTLTRGSGKNTITLKLTDESDQVLMDATLTDNEKSLELQYGTNKLKLTETTERRTFINSFGSGYACYGLSADDFKSNSYETIYTFLRVDNRSKVNTLKSLTVSDTKIVFKNDTLEYSDTIPYKISSVKIDSTLTDEKSSYIANFGNRTVDLDEGMNEILIKVKAENGDVKTYTLKIMRELNDDATLSKLMINEEEIIIKEDILDYSIILANDITEAKIVTTPSDKDAKVEISEIKELIVGSNKVTITVTAKNDNKKVYNLDIIRDELISINSKLKDLIIKDYQIDFYRDTYNYTLTIDKKLKNLDITVIPENEKATYQIIGNKKLKNKSVIMVEVTAEDGKTKSIYKINIVKNGLMINPFLIIGLLLLTAIGLISVTTIKKQRRAWKKR